MKGPVCIKTAIIEKVEVKVKEEKRTKEGKMKKGGVG